MNKLFALLCLLSISYTSAYYYCTCRDATHCGHLPASCEYSNNIVQLTEPQFCHKMYGLVCIRNNMEDTTCIRQGCILPRNTTIIKEVPIYIKENTQYQSIIYYINKMNYVDNNIIIYSSYTTPLSIYENIILDNSFTRLGYYTKAIMNTNNPEIYEDNKLSGLCLKYFTDNTYNITTYRLYNNTEYLLIYSKNLKYQMNTQYYFVGCYSRPYLNTTNNVVYINNTIIRDVPYYVNTSDCIEDPNQSQIIVTDHKYLYEFLAILLMFGISVFINLYVCFKTYRRPYRHEIIDSELNNIRIIR